MTHWRFVLALLLGASFPFVSVGCKSRPLAKSNSEVVKRYDDRFVKTVRTRWYKLLDQNETDERGKVILQFRLHYTGHVTDVKVVESTVSDQLASLCQRAILTGRYELWSAAMKKSVELPYRDVKFTFHYDG